MPDISASNSIWLMFSPSRKRFNARGAVDFEFRPGSQVTALVIAIDVSHCHWFLDHRPLG